MPPMMSAPQEQTLANGRVIQPKDMRAITVNKSTNIITRDLQGNRAELTVAEGRIGYRICDAPNMPGYVLCQLLNNDGKLQTVAILKPDVDVGELHGLRVERPPAIPSRRKWLLYHVVSNGRKMSIFRTRSRVVLASGHARVVIKIPVTSTSKWNMGCTIDELDPAPPVGPPVVVSLQVMDDGKPHAAPWYRGPLHGAWDNSHELLSFAVTVEWHDEATKKWFSAAVSYRRPLVHSTNFPSSSDNLHAA